MIQHFKITIEYDGTLFFGWQRQKDQVTVQGEIEKTLSIILNQTVVIAGSGRTDAGVHAWGQTASFSADTTLDCNRIKKAVNSLMKLPVVIRDCCIVPGDFHAQYSALSKEYHYVVLNRPDPCAIGCRYQWHIPCPLNLSAMEDCCRIITGVHDFKSFENTGSPRSSTVREIFCATIEPQTDDQLVFKIRASGFLKYMVRNIVGTLVAVGKGKISVDQFKKILDARDRKRAGATAPAHGLFLKKVYYENIIKHYSS